MLFSLRAFSVLGNIEILIRKFRYIVNDMLDGKISLEFITYGRWVFADEERVSGEGVTNSSCRNVNFRSSAEVVGKKPFFCVF